MKSPHFSSRKGCKPFIHVVHYTGSESVEGTLKWFLDPLSKVSAHFLIDKSGKIYDIIDLDKSAWHCGVSKFISNKYPDGLKSLNKYSFGYELVGVYGTQFTDEQYKSLAKCIVSILLNPYFEDANIIDLWENIVGHEHIAPRRKIDPGPTFDWGKLYNGIIMQLSSCGIPSMLSPVKYPPIIDRIREHYSDYK